MKLLKNENGFLVIYSAILSIAFLALSAHEKELRDENLAYRQNLSALMDSAVSYKVSDSLSACQVKELQVTISEYKQHRQEDAELIKKLKADKAETVTNTVTETTVEVRTVTKDSVVYLDTLKAINYSSKWTDLRGFINKDTVQVKITNREELLLVESVQRKKFLFFKLPIWLFGHKQRTVDVVSKNPNTTIKHVDYVNFR